MVYNAALRYSAVKKSVTPCMELGACPSFLSSSKCTWISYHVDHSSVPPGRCLSNPFLEPLMTAILASKVLAPGLW